jgi:hypothetical protein
MHGALLVSHSEPQTLILDLSQITEDSDLISSEFSQFLLGFNQSFKRAFQLNLARSIKATEPRADGHFPAFSTHSITEVNSPPQSPLIYALISLVIGADDFVR